MASLEEHTVSRGDLPPGEEQDVGELGVNLSLLPCGKGQFRFEPVPLVVRVTARQSACHRYSVMASLEEHTVSHGDLPPGEEQDAGELGVNLSLLPCGKGQFLRYRVQGVLHLVGPHGGRAEKDAARRQHRARRREAELEGVPEVEDVGAHHHVEQLASVRGHRLPRIVVRAPPEPQSRRFAGEAVLLVARVAARQPAQGHRRQGYVGEHDVPRTDGGGEACEADAAAQLEDGLPPRVGGALVGLQPSGHREGGGPRLYRQRVLFELPPRHRVRHRHVRHAGVLRQERHVARAAERVDCEAGVALHLLHQRGHRRLAVVDVLCILASRFHVKSVLPPS
ncbi:hypothetical protein DIPPA_64170, partial [Diplonema papillatum]